MNELDQSAISRILGSQVRPAGSVGFGNLRLRQTTAEIRGAFSPSREDEEAPKVSYEQDAVVVKAFEQTRDGSPIDELLWNKDLARAFATKCQALGLHGHQAHFVRRLLNVRKNAPRYKKHGIGITLAKKKESHSSIGSEYAHVIEFALVKLRYWYGASIDDILIDPALGEKFETLATEVAPGVSSADLRHGALYIRKHRVVNKTKIHEIESLDVQILENQWKGSLSLASTDLDDVPASPGLIELKEENRYLYISHSKDIHAAVSQLHAGTAFQLMGSSFWKPNPEAITLLFVPGAKVGGVSIEKWERKLIYDRDPVLNWPMPKKAA